MNKEQFLKQLGAHLKQLTTAERDDILSDIEEFFVYSAKDGETEADTAARLGDPKKLAKEYLAQAHIASANEKRTPKNMFLAFLYAAGLGTVNALYAIFVVGVGYIVIASLFITAVSVGLAGIAAIAASALSFAGLGIIVLVGFLIGIALISMGVLFFIGIMSLSKIFHKGNMAFLNKISDKIKEAGVKK